MRVLIPGAVGELIDKITICQIKVERLSSPEKLKNVQYEIELLEQVRAQYNIDGPTLEKMMIDLKSINSAIWELEDHIRDCERRNDFGTHFIELARSIYKISSVRLKLE